MRPSGRKPDEARAVTIERGFNELAPGSALIRGGRTVVLCTACIEDGVPPFLMNTNQGWLTAEYGMLPGCAGTRRSREGRRGAVDARSLEISRLIGRSLRAACNLSRLPGRSIWVDCDVLQADGGTRTLAISGAMVAVTDAFRHAERRGWLRGWPVTSAVAAISAGVVDGEVRLDLEYAEDSVADVDLNVVMNAREELIEIQSSGERSSFTQEQLTAMLALATPGVRSIFAVQERCLAEAAP